MLVFSSACISKRLLFKSIFLMQMHQAEYSGTELGSLLFAEVNLQRLQQSWRERERERRENAPQRKQSGLETSRLHTHLNSRRFAPERAALSDRNVRLSPLNPSLFIHSYVIYLWNTENESLNVVLITMTAVQII